MKTYQDVKADGSDFEISLLKFIGKPIKDIRGFINTEDGLSFELTKIIFEDGQSLNCEGEHDFPYVYGLTDKQEEELDNINKTDPDYEDEIDDEDNEDEDENNEDEDEDRTW